MSDVTNQLLSEQIDKMLAMLQSHVEASEKEHEEIRSGIKENTAAIVELSGKIDTYHQELLMLGRKVDRLEQAIHYIAQETGVKLKLDL